MQYNSKHHISNVGRSDKHDLNFPVMVGGKHNLNNNFLETGPNVANGPNVNIYTDEHNRNNEYTMTDNPWIFLTGGSGYIGSNLAATIKSSTSNNLMIIDRRAKLLPHTTKYCDVFADEDFSSHLIMQSIRDYNPSCIIHLAASSTIGPGLTDPMSYWENNVTKTLKLIQSCIDHNIKNFIFASTSSVYEDADIAVSEHGLCSPINSYARTKYTIELALQDVFKSHGLNSISFRFFNAAGAHSLYDLGELHGSSHLISKIMEAAAHNIPFTIYGKDYDTTDGTCIRDYTHVSDISEAITMSIPWLNSNPGAHIINLGAGKGYTVQQVVNTAEQILNIELPYRYGDRRDGDSVKRFANISKAKSLLNWNPTRTLNDIIRDSFKWYNSNTYKDLTLKRIFVDI